MAGPDDPAELRAGLAAALREIDVLRSENARLRAMLRLDQIPAVQAPLPVAEFARQAGTVGLVYVDRDSPPQQKIALFRALFAGRVDVYAAPWVSARTGKNGWRPAEMDR